MGQLKRQVATHILGDITDGSKGQTCRSQRILSQQSKYPHDMVLASEVNDIDSHSRSERLNTMPECISLLRTPLGQTVRLQSLDPLHPSLRRRLTDMGINEGSIIRLKNQFIGRPDRH